MKLSQTYETLFREFRKKEPVIQLKDFPVDIVTLPFLSDAERILPRRPLSSRKEPRDFFPQPDARIPENTSFTYTLFLPRQRVPHERVILLLHGLNEKNWKKYLPWALHLVESTGSAVLLFPIAFHMDRAPALWSQPRIMQHLTRMRTNLIRSLRESTFINAAISQRLDNFPLRFYLSGYQTANDIEKLLKQIISGHHPYFREDARVDVFAYSIGALLAQVMLLAENGSIPDRSRLFLFCGGSVFQEMQGQSRFIMDSMAFNRLLDYYVNHMEQDIAKHRPYTGVLKDSALGGAFRSMIGLDLRRDKREEILRGASSRLKVVGLEKDRVIAPDKIVQTMQGVTGDIPIDVEILDFPFQYSHEIPFPVDKGVDKTEVDQAFDEVFGRAASFFN